MTRKKKSSGPAEDYATVEQFAKLCTKDATIHVQREFHTRVYFDANGDKQEVDVDPYGYPLPKKKKKKKEEENKK